VRLVSAGRFDKESSLKGHHQRIDAPSTLGEPGAYAKKRQSKKKRGTLNKQRTIKKIEIPIAPG